MYILRQRKIKNVDGSSKKPLTADQFRQRRFLRRQARIVAIGEADDYRALRKAQQIVRERFGKRTCKRKPGGRDNRQNFAPASLIAALRRGEG